MATTTEKLRAGRNITGVQAGLGAVLAVLLLGLAWFLFLRGGPEPVTTSAGTPEPAAAPEEAPGTGPGDAAAKPPQAGGSGPPETDKLFAPKDPFEPLVDPVEAGATDDAATEGDTTAEDTTGGDATGGATDGGVTETDIPAGSDDADDGSAGGAVGGRTVKLTEVDTRAAGPPTATVTVDGTSYTVSEKETFATNFKVLNLYGECSSMLFGDDQFTLCEGEQVLK
jgi:hypothetical protein